MDRRRKTTVKDKALHRINIIQGHLSKIQKMIEENEYCIDILHQSKAVQSALSKIDTLIMEDHLRHCAKHKMCSDESEKAIEEIIKIMNKI